MTAQEAFRADYNRYAVSFRELQHATGFRLTEGNGAEITGERTGYTATAYVAAHPMQLNCRVFMGEHAARASREPGLLYCATSAGELDAT